MKEKVFLSLLVVLLSLPLFAFKVIENTQLKAIPQFVLVDKSILTSGNFDIEDNKTVEPDIDNVVIKHHDTDISDNGDVSDNTEMYEEVLGTERADPLAGNNDAEHISGGYVVQVGAYKSPDNAHKIFEKIRSDYLYAYIDRADNFNKVKIYGIQTLKEANLIIEEIHEKYRLTPYLLKEH